MLRYARESSGPMGLAPCPPGCGWVGESSRQSDSRLWSEWSPWVSALYRVPAPGTGWHGQGGARWCQVVLVGAGSGAAREDRSLGVLWEETKSEVSLCPINTNLQLVPNRNSRHNMIWTFYY